MAVGLVGVVAVAVRGKFEASIPVLGPSSGVIVGRNVLLQRGRESDAAGHLPWTWTGK